MEIMGRSNKETTYSTSRHHRRIMDNPRNSITSSHHLSNLHNPIIQYHQNQRNR